MEKKYKVNLNDPGRLIFLKNREVRTPVEVEVRESELDYIKLKIRAHGIIDYSISSVNNGVSILDLNFANDKEMEEPLVEGPQVEELEELEEYGREPKTLLEKLSQE